MKNTKIKLFFFLLFWSFFYSYSQLNISGNIINYDEPIGKANIQILSIDSIVVHNFAFSEESGYYQINVSTAEDFLLKITAHGYLDYYKLFKHPITENVTLDVFLERVSEELKEVVIIAHQKSARLEGDKIIYNLKAVRDSTEQNLGDLIQKLPGLELTDEGVVKFQGVVIDKILIEGKDFFGGKQQLATENISADMVDEIDLLLKHQENVNLKEFSENSKIALNIKLNDKSRNRILGNIAGSIGVQERYSLHANLFNFFNNGNVSFISDLNNIGEMPLTVPDYIEIIGGLNSSSRVGVTSINDLIPLYIYNENRVETKENIFSALNFVYGKDRLNLSSNLIFNGFNQRDVRETQKFFFNNSVENIKETFVESSKNLLLSTIFKLNYKLNENSDINYIFNYSPVKGEAHSDIRNPLIFKNSKADRSTTMSNDLKYNYKFNENFLLTFNLLYENNYVEQGLKINTQEGNNLFEFERNVLQQNFSYSTEKYGAGVGLIYINNKNKYKFDFTSLEKVEIFESSLFRTSNQLERTTKVIRSSFDLKHYISNSLFVNYYFSPVSYSIVDGLENEIKFENNLNIVYEFNNANNISAGISNIYSLNELNQQLNSYYVSDYQNLNITPNLEETEFINLKSLNLSFSNFYQKYEQFFTLNLSYSFSAKNITTNSYLFQNYNYFNYVLGSRYRNISGMLLFDRNFGKIPLVNKSSLTYSYNTSDTFLKGERNINENINISLNLQLLSNFKKSRFQFQMAYNLKKFFYKQSLFPKSFQTDIQSFSSRFISKWGQFRIESDFRYLIQRNEYGYNSQFIISPGLWYYSKLKVWELSIQTDNILHLERFNNLTQFSNEIFIANSVQAVMPGYVLFGIKYNL